MIKEFKRALTIIAIFLLSYLGSLLTDPAMSFLINILPFSIFELTREHYIALMFTLLSSVVAWFFAVVIGYILGQLVGLVSIHKNITKYLHYLSTVAKESYNIIYIIPLVITLNFVYAVLNSFKTDYNLPSWIVALGAIATAGIALGGYQVFMVCYNAVIRSGEHRLFLAQSLYSKHDDVDHGNFKFKGYLKKHLRSLVTVRRLTDFEIRSFANALEIAFHLAVVAIVILETITPQFYELILPQSGVSPKWSGGIGRLVLIAQSNYNFHLIAGMLWAVVFFDFFFIIVLTFFIQRRWLKFYRS